MTRHLHRHSAITVLAALAATASLLAACGGGGGSSTPTSNAGTAAPPAPTPLVTISGTVADGPLSGATVCYDLNDNGACDIGEPFSVATTADGRYSFSVEPATAGKHTVVAEVPATAVDKDTGTAVGTAYTLQSPATGTAGAQSVFVSPLTSLVQVQLDASGGTLADAAGFVKAQAGLSVSPMADFTSAAMLADPAGKQAAMVARLAMLTWLNQMDAASGAVGQTDLSGGVATQKDLRRAVAVSVLGQLPAVAAGVADAAVVQATDAAARTKALSAVAADITRNQGGLTAAQALASIGTAKLPADLAPEVPAAGGNLPILRFTDTDNWFFRAFLWTGPDTVPDASGMSRFYDVRTQRSAGSTASWSFSSSRDRQGDLHWNGSAWVDCPLGTRSKTTGRDAQGRATSDFCDGYEVSASVRHLLDISGKTLRNVAETIRAFPGSYSGVAYADWGPADLALLGNATFPAGSQMRYQSNLTTRTAYAYDVRASATLTAFAPEIAAGGDARGSNTPPCRAVNSSNTASFLTPVLTLEDMAARNPGTACNYNPGTSTGGSSGDQNDWWGNSTVSLGSVANVYTLPAGTGSYYTTTANVRVGFVPGTSSVNFYGCFTRASDGSARNCTLLSTGSYAIETLGDGRVMSFTGQPALALRTGSARVFVERGGKVYAGYLNPVGASSTSVRLNLLAANAVFSQLGMPTLVP